jgi:hypothetical protein
LANNFIAREHNKDEEMLKRNAKTCFDFGSVIGGYVTQEFYYSLVWGNISKQWVLRGYRLETKYRNLAIYDLFSHFWRLKTWKIA